MIILYYALLLGVALAGYVFGTNVKRAQYESRIEELTAQRNAATTMLDHLRGELEELREEFTPAGALPTDAAIRRDNVVRLALAEQHQARLQAEMRQLIDSAS